MIASSMAWVDGGHCPPYVYYGDGDCFDGVGEINDDHFSIKIRVESRHG